MSNASFSTPHAVSTKADGSMKNSDGTISFNNLTTFLHTQKLPEVVVAMEQVHGGNVKTVLDNKENQVSGVDALITNKKEISLAAVTADCLPILLYDPQKKAIGVIHAGSKGLLCNVIQNTIHEFKKSFSSNPEDILIFVGPAIEESCYEVSKEFAEQFSYEAFLLKDGKYFLNIRKIALQCLLKEGILREHIELSEQCTKCSVTTYFSYRNGDKTGRFVSVISL